jgi:hypothetical protein
VAQVHGTAGGEWFAYVLVIVNVGLAGVLGVLCVIVLAGKLVTESAWFQRRAWAATMRRRRATPPTSAERAGVRQARAAQHAPPSHAVSRNCTASTHGG